MDKQLFIPKIIKVGFNYRKDTYTKKLAYVIYYDNKGKLRKEMSWTNWIQKPGDKVHDYHNNESAILDETYAPVELENVPMEGFVLNKGVGGQRQSWGWNARNEYIRVYDPRGFEFEISVANLLFILQECTSSQGKGLEGEFIYSWDGKDLVLLPCISNEYKTSMEFTNIQSNKVSKTDMEEGSIYVDKKQNRLIYLGRLDYREIGYDDSSTLKKKHLFYDVETKKFVPHVGFTKLAIRETTTCVDNYAELVDEFLKSKHGSFAVSIFTKPAKLHPGSNSLHEPQWRDHRHNIYLKENDNYYEVNIETIEDGNYYDKNRKVISYKINQRYKVNNKTFNKEYIRTYYDHDGRKQRFSKEQILSMDFVTLYLKLDSGGEILIDDYLSNY